MTFVIAVLAAIALVNGAAAATPAANCDVPESLIPAESDLTRVAQRNQGTPSARYQRRRFGSSALTGPDGARFAYPAQLEQALKQRLPGTEIKVTAHIQSRQTTADMVGGLPTILAGRQAGAGDLAGRHGRCAARRRAGGFPHQPRPGHRCDRGGQRRRDPDEHAIQPAHRNHAERFRLRGRHALGGRTARRCVV